MPRLLLLASPSRSHLPLPDLAREAVAGGADALLVRAPDLAPEALRALAEPLATVLAGGAALLVSREVGVARALGCGVQLPERGGSAVAAREVLGPGALVGRSVHSANAAADAASDGADYLLAGHCFPTASHPGQPPIGPDGLRAIAVAARSPVLAIGGIDAGNAAAAIRAGAAGVAVLGAIGEAADPARAAAAIRAAVDAALRGASGAMDDRPTGSNDATVPVTVNGKPLDLPVGTTVSAFLTGKRLTDGMAIVELNGTILGRDAYPATTLRPGDQLEVVHAVGGG